MRRMIRMLLIVMVAALVVGIVSTLKLNMLIQSLIYAIVIGLVIYAIAKKVDKQGVNYGQKYAGHDYGVHRLHCCFWIKHVEGQSNSHWSGIGCRYTVECSNYEKNQIKKHLFRFFTFI